MHLVVAEAILPGCDVGDEQDGEAQQGGGHSADAEGAAKDPEGHGQAQSASCDLLVLRHGAQLRQLLPCLHGRVRGVLRLWRVDHIPAEQSTGRFNSAPSPSLEHAHFIFAH